MSMWNYVSVAALVTLLSSWAGGADPESPEAKSDLPSGHFIVYEELWTELADEPGRHMDLAREAYLAVDARDAAAELRKAATYLKISAGNAVDGSKRPLLRAAHELETLAHGVEAGTVKSVHELDAASARALHALSHYHCVLGEKSWAAEQRRAAGKQLRAAADNLERAAARSGRALQTATREVAADARIVSGKLVEGTGYLLDDVGKAFVSLGQGVENVGKGIEPHPATAAKQSVPTKDVTPAK